MCILLTLLRIEDVRARYFGSPSPLKIVRLMFPNSAHINRYLEREWDDQVWVLPEDTDREGGTEV